MKFNIIVLSITLIVLFGIAVIRIASPQQESEWIKYLTWEGDVDEMCVFRIQDEVVKADYPVGSGFKNAKATFFAGDPNEQCIAKIDVQEGRGVVAISKQCWQPPESFVKVQIYDKESGFGHYKFTVYYMEKELTPSEKSVYQKLVNKAIYDFDVYQLNKALSKDNLADALRWARSAYEIDRLNWEMLNIIGATYYKMGSMEKAEDAFVILRDYAYLTEDNKKRFKEIAPYEYSKLEEKEKEEGKVEEDDEDDEDEGINEDDEDDDDEDEDEGEEPPEIEED